MFLGVFNFGISFIHKQAPNILGYATDIRIEKLFEATNAKRTEAGLSTLILNQALSQAAQAKAEDMFANGYWAHNSPQGKTPWDFIVSAGYRYTLAGENLAKNFDTSVAVVDAWMGSPTHKDNILKGGYQEVGFAVVNGILNGEETTLVVQMFGTSATPQLAQVPQVQAQEPQPSPLPAVEVVQEKVVSVEVSSEPAAQIEEATPTAFAGSIGTGIPPILGGVKISPLIDIPRATHMVAYMFIGLIVGVLAVDSFVIWRKKLVRLAGHNIAHILFLTTIAISSLTLVRGALV